ncbi:MAG TPA: hypothetical protein PK306_15650 [Aquabacterium sp.]|nr:hypothetical protein [Aquabacterium sp.]HQC97138.1 hypothetical protein [Aquabacterium sp.]
MTIKTKALGLGTALLATAAQAHDGHGDHDALGVLATLAHPLTVQQALTALLLACVAGRVLLGGRRGALGYSLVAGAAAAATGLALLARA